MATGRPYAKKMRSSVRILKRDVSPEAPEGEVRALAARHGQNGDEIVTPADRDISGGQ